jgi:phage terminase large subunit-like protein
MGLSYSARALRYARRVVSGKQLACKYVKLACERHLKDLERSKKASYPYRFSSEKGDRICKFGERMVHIKGAWAGQRIQLEDWQCFLLAVPFGWVRKSDGLRKYREIYAEIPRKNAKSTTGAIIGNYMTVADDEPGAEVFCGATTEDQALKVFEPAWKMVDKNPDFKEYFGLSLSGTEKFPGNIHQLGSGSYFRMLIGKPGDGDNPHCAIVDEYHEHKTSEQYDAMKTGMGARRQPMRVVITTAGTDTSAPCYDKHQEAIKVLEGTLENEEMFAIIFTIDEGDDWKNFKVWPKANPNHRVSVYDDYLRSQLRDALQKPGDTNTILTKHLNMWMNAGKAWMNMAFWDRQCDPLLKMEDFLGQECWLAFDLANKIDICSVAAIFKTYFGFVLFCKHYLPERTILLPHNAHYRKWLNEGWLIQTGGARTDFKRIEDDIRELSKKYAVQELAFDPKEASYLIQNIQEWASFECVEMGQGPALISEPMKEMEAAIYAGEDPEATEQLKHNGDPILTWMMGNVVKKEGRGSSGPVKYYYPTKERDANKIDGIVAGIMALARAKLHEGHGWAPTDSDPSEPEPSTGRDRDREDEDEFITVGDRW